MIWPRLQGHVSAASATGTYLRMVLVSPRRGFFLLTFLFFRYVVPLVHLGNKRASSAPSGSSRGSLSSNLGASILILVFFTLCSGPGRVRSGYIDT